jgi:dolichol-phosphate mannosyltransferase
MNKKISIIVPVFFNAESLPTLFQSLTNLEKKLCEKTIDLELFFVDDGSKDASLKRLLEFKVLRPSTTIIKLTRNFGAVHASKSALRFVTGDAFIFVAADLQDPPELILDMADHWLAGNKFIICERISRDDPLISKIFSFMYYKLLRTFVISDYPKGGYDMALMDKIFLPHLINSSKTVFTPLLTFWLGYEPKVIKYSRPKRKFGRSSWSFSKKFTAFLDVMLGFSATPIRAISTIGFIVAIGSFLYGASVVINAIFNRIPVEGFATLASLFAFLLGLIIIMLGLIGEYLWRIFDETNKRPECVIENVW